MTSSNRVRYSARGPQCNPQSAKGPSMLQSASIRTLPCRTCEHASGVRSVNCEGRGAASKSAAGAPKECAPS
eukprot:5227498-Alexandrium_andersonii.AAC.1